MTNEDDSKSTLHQILNAVRKKCCSCSNPASTDVERVSERANEEANKKHKHGDGALRISQWRVFPQNKNQETQCCSIT